MSGTNVCKYEHRSASSRPACMSALCAWAAGQLGASARPGVH